MPSTPSQKSIDICRPAPVSVMWCTPWLWSFCIVSTVNSYHTSLDFCELRQQATLAGISDKVVAADRIYLRSLGQGGVRHEARRCDFAIGGLMICWKNWR